MLSEVERTPVTLEYDNPVIFRQSFLKFQLDAFKEIAMKSGLEASSWKSLSFHTGGQEWIRAETLYKKIIMHGLSNVLLCRKDGKAFLYTK